MQNIGTFTRPLATVVSVASLVLASPAHAAEDIAAGGAFSCDFKVRGDTPLNSIPPMLERDRMYMADRPGMLRKDVPLSFNPDPASPNLFGGGRYLFDSFEHAQDYKDFVEEEFVLDGVQLLKRPYFISAGDCLPTCWNGVQDPGETSANCPGDVRLFPKDE
jgi:hypothetical protein